MILDDVFAPKLGIVFCGTAAGPESARRRAYYAHPQNVFWRTLHKVGLTERQFAPEEFRCLADYRLGLSDLAQKTSGTDRKLKPEDFDGKNLEDKVRMHHPAILAFTSKKAAKVFLNRKKIDYGFQEEKIGATRIFVLPSPSAAARRYWDEGRWRELASEWRRED